MPEAGMQSIETDVHALNPSETAVEGELLTGELLVEDVSIDGMCGVY